MSHHPVSTDGGATLIEVMVSLALVVVGLLGIYSAYTASVRATAHGNRVTQATSKAERQLELLRHAPTQAITCLAACNVTTACSGTCAPTCSAQCCAGLADGGTSCVPGGSDAGVASDICNLVPAAEATLGGTTYTYCDPIVRKDPTLPFLYDVRVRVQYAQPGDEMQGTDVRTLILRTALYKP